MIEVLDVPARPHADPATGKPKYFWQKIRVTTEDRDGFTNIETFDRLSNPDAVLVPADDYVIDPTRYHVSTTRDDRGYDRKSIATARNAPLIRVGELIKLLSVYPKSTDKSA